MDFFDLAKRFVDHQIGYLYKTVATAIAAGKSQLLTVLPNYVGQGAAGLKAAIAQVFGKDGVLGVEVEQIVDRGIDNLDANALANIENNAPAAIDALVAHLEAHATEMLAA